MFEAAGRLLEGSSGGDAAGNQWGADSMVMAHLFQWFGRGEEKQMNRRKAVAHMNFSLRGSDSDGDQSFVEASGPREGFIPFYAKKVDTLAYASEKGISTEMAARELRYAWFEWLCREHGLSHIAVAHNANDRAETMLLNLVRGTGLRGLCSLKRQDHQAIA